MSIEIAFSAANLLVLVGYALKLEGRIARLEALLEAATHRRGNPSH